MNYKTSIILLAFMLMCLSEVSFANIETITKTIKQPFGGSQSPDDARIAAVAKVKREALEEAGTYLESLTIVKNAVLQKDEIVALAAGILKTEIVSQRNYASEDGFGIEVVAKVKVDTGLLEERVQRMLDDRELLEKYQKSQQRVRESLARIRELEEQNRKLKDSLDQEKKKILKEQFRKASRELSASDLNEKALALWDNGMYTDVEKAMEYLRQAVKLDPEFAGAYNSLGMAYLSKGDYISSIEYFQKTLEIGGTQYGPDHLETAAVHNNLGQAYSYMGDYDNAIKHSKKALDIYIRNRVPDHPDTAYVYSALGSAYFIKGEYDRALENHEKALQMTSKKLGADHPGLVTIYNNIGATYYAKGEYDRSLEFYQKAYQILLKVMGPGHTYVATIHTNLGKTYRVKGDYDEAKKHFQEAMKILLKNVGPGHPHVAYVYDDLGSVFYNMGDYDRALQNFQNAYEIRAEYLGPDHVDLVLTHNNFGKTYRIMGDSDRAKEHFQQALQIALKRFGADDPSTKAIQEDLDTVDQPHARIETVSGDKIGFRLKNTKGFSLRSRVDVSLSVGWDIIPFGTWCIDTSRRDKGNKTLILTALPVKTQGKAAMGMDVKFIALEGAQETAWLQKAAAAGCAEAQYRLGLDYSWGNGVEQDRDKGISLLREAAVKDHVDAQYSLAMELSRKVPVGEPMDEKMQQERFLWFRKAAENGHWRAAKWVGMYYLGHDGDIDKAEYWYRRAAELSPRPDEDILYEFAFPLEAMGMKDKAIDLYRESARMGKKRSQERLRKLGLGW